MTALIEYGPVVAAIAMMVLFLVMKISDTARLVKLAKSYAAMLDPVDGKTLGGWWIADNPRPRVVARIRCQAPRMDLYRENLNCRRGRRLPAGNED